MPLFLPYQYEAVRCALGRIPMKLVILLLTAALVSAADPQSGRIGRPVRVLSLSFNGESLETIRQLIDVEAGKGVDLVILPETWRGQKDDTMETLDGPTVNAMAALARKHHTYIVCPIDRRDGDRRLNSAVLIGRDGRVVFVYDKVYP